MNASLTRVDTPTEFMKLLRIYTRETQKYQHTVMMDFGKFYLSSTTIINVEEAREVYQA
jgi:hypothetical protein